jgi:hypothetical protein
MTIKRRSKITAPRSFGSKNRLYAFRADNELTALLDQVPNKSEFITAALLQAFADSQLVTCWTCKGAGKLCVPERHRRLAAAS